ncbi:MAG: nucleoside monophosphate kinase [Holosporales bacterium]|jgi:adenylate kinase|nr:nucleoside monophosphate kinase [Holosporales bacterium]
MENLWVVLLGAPGCGKGTQSEFLIKDFGFSVISVGEVLRTRRNELVPGGNRTVGEVLDAGDLLPDSVILKLVESELDDFSAEARKNVLFDGVPRTIGQADGLATMAAGFGRKIDLVLSFSIDDNVVIKRILGRYSCAKCGKVFNDFFLRPDVEGVCDACGCTEFDRRTDDNEVALKHRLCGYHEKTGPLVDFYSGVGILRSVDAGCDFECVKGAIYGILNEKEVG